MALSAVNIWTGAPLLGLWVGSQLQGSGPPEMGPIFAAVAVMVAGILVLMRLLTVLGTRYDARFGLDRQVRRHVPWLRSMRGERPHEHGEAIRISALDRVLVITVVVAVVAFEIWFFFFSGSPIDQRSGR
jgi:hypothetical protein